MKISLFTICTLILFATLQLNAETVLFRAGKILGAELTTKKIPVYGVPQEMPINIPAKPVYAVVTVKLDRFRSISIFDYALEASGTQFLCVAIRTQSRFVHTDAPINSTEVVQLLFIADTMTAAKEKLEIHTIKSRLAPAGVYDVKVPFSNIGSDTPKEISEIPAEGIIVFKKAESPRPAPAEANNEGAQE